MPLFPVAGFTIGLCLRPACGHSDFYEAAGVNSRPAAEPYYEILRFLSRMTQNQAIAERLTLEIAGRAVRARFRFEKGHAPATELYRMAYEACRGAGCTAPDDPLCRMLGALNEQDRAALVLHKFHCLDCCEIGRILDCPAWSVAQVLVRAYRSLAATAI